MKILLATTHFGFLRNLEPALHLLAERGHQIHLIADRRDNVGGMKTVEQLVGAHPAEITWSWAPNPKTRAWFHLGSNIRLCLDYWRYLHPRYAHSPRLKARAATQVPPLAVTLANVPGLRTWSGIRMLAALARAMERAVPYGPDVRRFLEQHRPDVVLVTPLLYFGSPQVDWVRAARALGIPTTLCVGSWDHLTTKGMIHDIPDRVTVWNEAQRQEAWEIHGVPPEKVAVTGAQAYDRWFVAQPSLSREAFCARIGLDPARPILLYLCSSQFIAPHEVGFVQKWVRAIRSHVNPQVAEAGLLIRPHPQNFEQWREVDFSDVGNVAIVPRGGANPVDAVARAEYFDSMYYSAAVVGVNTSALIESGIVGRSVYTVLSDEFTGTQEGTLHFRHLTTVNGGLLHVAASLEEHVGQIERALAEPAGLDPKARSFIQAFIRPHGLDVPAAPIFADVVEDVARRGATAPARDARWVIALRALLYPAAVGARALANRKRRLRKEADDERRRPEDGLRILVAMASPEYLRYYDTTIRLLAERGHHVIVTVNQQKERKKARLDGLDTDSDRIEIVGLAPKRSGVWGRIGKGLRGVTDFSRFLHPRYAHAPVLRARMKRKVLPVAFRFVDWVPSLGAHGARWLQKGLRRLEQAIPSGREIEEFIRRHDPDIVMVTPLIDAASDQVELVKSAKALGIRTAVGIASWDNLTNKGLLRVEPDAVIVWNEIQKGEAVEFHAISPDRVAVTGAQLFDRWFERRPSRTRDALCELVGLPPDRPFVLFTCSSGFISESHLEVPFVRSWIEGLRASGDPAVRDLSVLVRPHPYNTAAWEVADLSDLGAVAIWPRQRYNAVDETHRAAYFDSLYYSVAVVGINTSAMVEAAIVGRPVLSIVTPDFARTQEGTLHFHYLLPENGGCVRVAASFDEHVGQLAAVLRDPDTTRAETARFVSAFVRPHGVEIPCTPIVADRLEQLARSGRPRPERTPLWAAPLQAGLLVLGAYAGAVAWVTRPKTRGMLKKGLRTRTHRLRKLSVKTMRVTGSRIRDLTTGTRRGLSGAPSQGRRLAHWSGVARNGAARVRRRLMRLARLGRYHAAMLVRHRGQRG